MSARVAYLRAQRHIDRAKRERSCGTCSACCTALAIKEIAKPKGEPCPHLAVKGCGIYDRRPRECREYHCLWRGGLVASELRPDRSGVIFDAVNDGSDAIIAREIVPGALDGCSALIEDLAQKVAVVLMREGRLRRVIGPPEMVARFTERLHKHLDIVEE